MPAMNTPSRFLPALLSTLLFAACGAPPIGIPDAEAGMDAEAPGDGSAPDSVDGSEASVPVRHRVLFVGNSYVYINDVSGHYRTIASAFLPATRVEQVTAGGYRLAQHAQDARTDGTPLARWLRTGSPEETAFDAVVLQEQSQIGGFPDSVPERAASVAAASELSALATARGAAVVLYMTWGYRNGDPMNGGIGYGTYTGMQNRLDEGYLSLAALLRDRGVNVRVAPVGGGFRTVYEDVTSAGGDPAAVGSDFHALYEPDGSHPSLRGAYLAACIIAGTTTAVDARSFVDEPALGPDLSRRLRDVCARTLADPRWEIPTSGAPSP
jgi:hypothetical protein